MPDDNVDGTALGRMGRIEKARVDDIIIAKADSSSRAATVADSGGNCVRCLIF